MSERFADRPLFKFLPSRELGNTVGLQQARLRNARTLTSRLGPICSARAGADPQFSLRSLPLKVVEIPGRLSSSLLPPLFAWGRFATLFFAPALEAIGLGAEHRVLAPAVRRPAPHIASNATIEHPSIRCLCARDFKLVIVPLPGTVRMPTHTSPDRGLRISALIV